MIIQPLTLESECALRQPVVAFDVTSLKEQMKAPLRTKFIAVLALLLSLQSLFVALNVILVLGSGYTPKYPIYHAWVEGVLTMIVGVAGLIGNINLIRYKQFFLLCLTFIIADLFESLHGIYTFSLMESSPPTLGSFTIARWIFAVAYLSTIIGARKSISSAKSE